MIAYNYSEIDPILKENPDITRAELQKKGLKISQWSLLSRKALLQGRPGYGRNEKQTQKLFEKKTPQLNWNEDIIETLYSKDSDLKNEYRLIADTLLKNPSTTYKKICRDNPITMSDSNFYAFRKKFVKKMKLMKVNGQKIETESNTRVRRRNILYQTIFEKEIEKSFNPKSLELLQDFINTLNQEKILNAELFEIVSPKHIIEIRSYSK